MEKRMNYFLKEISFIFRQGRNINDISKIVIYFRTKFKKFFYSQ